MSLSRESRSAPPVPSSSPTDIGCTPLSERLWGTRFSHSDCMRSIWKGSSFMAGRSSLPQGIPARLPNRAGRFTRPPARLRGGQGQSLLDLLLELLDEALRLVRAVTGGAESVRP